MVSDRNSDPAPDAVDVSANIEAVRRLVEDGFNAGDPSVGALCGPDFVNYVCAYGVPSGPAGLTEHISMIRTAYPDISIRVTDVVADADEVSIRWISSGTAHGEYMGNSAGDYQFQTTQIAFYTLRGGLLVDWHGNYDPLAMGRPAPSGARHELEASVWAAATARVATGTSGLDTAALAALLNAHTRSSAGSSPLAEEVDLTVNGQPVPGGSAAFTDRYRGLRASFDAGPITVDRLIVHGERAALRWTLEGWHRSDFLGIRPTGRRVRLTSSALLHLTAGQISTWHEVFDDVGFLDQTKTAYVLGSR